MSYKKQYGGHRNDSRPQYTNPRPNSQPQQAQAYVAKSTAPVTAPTPAIVPEVTERQSLPPINLVAIISGIWAFLRTVLSYSPIKAVPAKKERKLIVIKVFGFEFMDVEWTDLLLFVLVIAANILIDQGLVLLHMQLTDEYYMASLGILLVLVTSLVFLDKHGYKYPIMVGVIVAALLGMYMDMASIKDGNSFVFVSAFVLAYKFVIEPIIEAVKRLFGPKNQVVAESTPVSNPVVAAPAPVVQTSTLMAYDEAVKVIKSKVVGVAANWREYRDAIIATFHAKFPEYETETILQELAMALKDWPGGSFEDLLASFSITDNITRPKLPDVVAPQPPVETNPLLKFLDLSLSTDRVLKLVKDWPNPITSQFVEERRTALRAIVEKYAELAEERPQDVMVKFSSPTFAQKSEWNYLWENLITIITDAIKEMEDEIVDETEITPSTTVFFNVPEAFKPNTTKLVVPDGTEGLTVWQLVLQKADWNTTPAAKTTFTKVILNPLASKLGWSLDDEDDNYTKLWLLIKESPQYKNPFDKRDSSLRAQSNQATIDWLIDQMPVPA